MIGTEFNKNGFRNSAIQLFGATKALWLCGPVNTEESVGMDDMLGLVSQEGLLISAGKPGWNPNGFESIAPADQQLIAALLIIHGASPKEMVYSKFSRSTLAFLITESCALWDTKNRYPDHDIIGLMQSALSNLKAEDAESYFEDGFISNAGGTWHREKVSRLLGSRDNNPALDAVYDIDASDSSIQDSITRQETTGNVFQRAKMGAAILEDAPDLWFLAGNDLEKVFSEVERRLRIVMEMTGLPMSEQDVKDAMAVYVARRTAFSPELGARFNVQGCHLLGLDVFAIERFSQASVSNCWYRPNAHQRIFEGPLSAMAFKKDRYSELRLKSAAKHYPDVMNPENAVRIMSKSNAWEKRIKSMEAIMSPLSKMHDDGIWHPLLTRPEFAERADRETSRGILIDYLTVGAKWREKQAKEVVQRGMVSAAEVIPLLSQRKQFLRLNSLTRLTPDEFSLIPKKFKPFLLKDELGL